MARTLLIRGMLAGLVAAAVAFVVAQLLGEPQVGHAIAFEGARAAAQGQTTEPEMVSRTVQRTLGLATGVGLFGVSIGGAFALVYALLQGRVDAGLGPRATAGLLALAGFVTVFLVPFLKYPANPPAIGNPDTLGRRTALYFAMIATSVLIGAAATLLGRRLRPRLGSWNATLIGACAYLTGVAVLMLVLPPVHEVPVAFPATVLWQFRLASVAIQVVTWTTLGIVFGTLTQRQLASPDRPVQPPSVPRSAATGPRQGAQGGTDLDVDVRTNLPAGPGRQHERRRG